MVYFWIMVDYQIMVDFWIMVNFWIMVDFLIMVEFWIMVDFWIRGELFNYGWTFLLWVNLFIMRGLLMDSPAIPQGLDRRPNKDWPKAKNALAEGQSPPQ